MQLSAPPEFATFSYADFLARQGVYSLIDRPRVSVLGHDRGNPVLSIIAVSFTLSGCLPVPSRPRGNSLAG